MRTDRLIVSALTLALATTGLAAPVWAADASAPEKAGAATPTPNMAATKSGSAENKSDVQKVMKFSADGQAVIRDVSDARVAIFEGEPKSAEALIEKAKASLSKAETDAPNYDAYYGRAAHGNEVNTKADSGPTPGDAKMAMIPVDGSVALAEDYVPTTEKQGHIAKANEHFKKGETQAAIDELKLGQIDVVYNRVWMPLASAKSHLDDANKLMGEQKYYEANLALKGIGDSLHVDTVDLVGTPVKAPLETSTKN